MTDRELLPPDEELRLVELVNRVLDRGVVLSGDVLISVAGIELVYLELRLMLAAVETARKAGANLPPRRSG
jgi:gas vesicle structural protein